VIKCPRANSIRLIGGLLQLTNNLVLASLSPRRKEILSWGGWIFEVVPADIDETAFSNEDSEEYVLRLAEKKALHVASQLSAEKIVIAADTIVVDGNQILGKPKNAEDAEKMLMQLRGRNHQVKTAIAIVINKVDERVSEIITTNVPMRMYSKTEIESYIASGDPFDKAGGYAIQNTDFKPANKLSGCFANVVGLPICHLTRLLKSINIVTNEDIANICQNSFDYECDIADAIL
jgi:septum formation protein